MLFFIYGQRPRAPPLPAHVSFAHHLQLSTTFQHSQSSWAWSRLSTSSSSLFYFKLSCKVHLTVVTFVSLSNQLGCVLSGHRKAGLGVRIHQHANRHTLTRSPTDVRCAHGLGAQLLPWWTVADNENKYYCSICHLTMCRSHFNHTIHKWSANCCCYFCSHIYSSPQRHRTGSTNSK